MATIGNARRLACVKCDALQPENGKLLSCFHIVCPGCATDSVDGESNCIKCSFCGDVTEPRVSGIPLSQQLARCEPSLYNSADIQARLEGTASGSHERRLCDFCNEGSEGEATHSCDSCSGALLCAGHVEQHSRKRVFAGHVLRLLSDEQLRPGKLSTREACFFHKTYDVITYCRTCSHSVCGECLRNGHSGHTMETLQAVVDSERSSIASMTESKAKSTNTTPGKPISSLIEAASREMEEMTEEARVASTVVTDTFGHIESVLQKKRQELLQKIDKTHWQQLEVSESRQQHLYRLEEAHATLWRLTDSVASGEMKDTDVIRVAGALKKNLAKLESDLLSAQARRHRAGVTATPSPAAIRQIEADITSLVKVLEAEIFDIETSVVTIPDDVHVMEEFIALITLPIPTGNPTPEISASYTAPSGERSKAPVSQSGEVTNVGTALSARVKPMEEGVHTLEIRGSANRVKSVAFTSRQARAFAFDPEKCSSQITLANKNRTARCTVDQRFGMSVAGRVGYTGGRHSWNVRISHADASSCTFGLGVVGLQPPPDYNKKAEFFGARQVYCWFSSGAIRARPIGTLRSSECIQSGDLTTLTLDCDNSTLELHLHRTNRRHTIQGVDCSKPLYPAVCMATKGQEAEFY